MEHSTRGARDVAWTPGSVKVIGPFLGLLEDGVRVVLALPGRTTRDLTCSLTGPSAPGPIASSALHGAFNVFTFDFHGLVPNEHYSYAFRDGAGAVDLEGELTADDREFLAPGPWREDDSFVLVSCHNPFATGRASGSDPWAMWHRLAETIRDDRVRLLVLGGDQVYNDDLEVPWIALLALSDSDELKEKVRQRFIAQYQKYWGHPAYRRVLARVPSVAMWDDHDITDGWGSRPESFDRRGEITTRWQRYFAIASEAFAAYQAVRNPPRLAGAGEDVYTAHVDAGGSRFYLLDLRSQRNAKKMRTWDPAHEAAVAASIEATPSAIRRMFVLSPVVAFRTSFAGDRRLSALTRKFFAWVHFIERHRGPRYGVRLLLALTWWFAMTRLEGNGQWWAGIGLLLLTLAWGAVEVLPRVPELPHLTDDLEDGLTADPNRKMLQHLLKMMFDWERSSGGRAILLSGDIHVFGISEVIDVRDAAGRLIPQIVSSPVGYKPMAKVVLGFTTTTSEMVLPESGKTDFVARNIFYVSKRNYAQVFPARCDDHRGAGAVHFHVEGHRLPISMPLHFVPSAPEPSDDGRTGGGAA